MCDLPPPVTAGVGMTAGQSSDMQPDKYSREGRATAEHITATVAYFFACKDKKTTT